MKKKNFQETKDRPAAELQKDLAEYRERLRVLKFDLAAGKVKNIREIRAAKKSVAQILTILTPTPKGVGAPTASVGETKQEVK